MRSPVRKVEQSPLHTPKSETARYDVVFELLAHRLYADNPLDSCTASNSLDYRVSHLLWYSMPLVGAGDRQNAGYTALLTTGEGLAGASRPILGITDHIWDIGVDGVQS